MNIKDAKQEIKNSMLAYFSKNEFGQYEIPIEKQRPVFLMGPPGIGKTAIMEQIAEELGVALVAYSMTHHTRQSALGLPFIEKKVYEGKEYDVSEYTMSEIIASVYEVMKATGLKEGILFLDEINCVSETLAPSMLQFLQYKIFGRHKIPSGWIVVTAGNPSEYNDSVREFDIVTWDRLKRIDVEPSYRVWRDYATMKGTHNSVTTYLDIRKNDFYMVESSVNGKMFVTARGWSDLSEMIRLYEKNDIKVSEALVSQYLQNPKIARSFSVYYDLYNKYKSDYQIEKILNGQLPDEIRTRASNAKMDERIAVLGLLLDRMRVSFRSVYLEEQILSELLKIFKKVKVQLSNPAAKAKTVLNYEVEYKKSAIEKMQAASAVSSEKMYIFSGVIKVLEEEIDALELKSLISGLEAFNEIKRHFDRKVKDHSRTVETVSKKLSNFFVFCEEVFKEGHEILILVTELTVSHHSAYFLGKYGSEEYFRHNKELLFHDRHKEIISELEQLEI